MTDFKSFLTNPAGACAQRYVVCLQTHEQSLLFVVRVRAVLARVLGLPAMRIDLQQIDEAAARRQLETSFLGQRQLFVLAGCDQVSDKVCARWRDYLSAYAGPHVVLTSMPAGSKWGAGVLALEVPERVGAQDLAWLLPLWDEREGQRVSQFVSLIIQRAGAVTPEQVCLLAQYAGVLGSGAREFMHEWAELVVRPEQSLFDLSSRLFAGDTQRFLAQWARMRTEYPAVFWTAYWSEQFFRAYWYVQTKKAGDAETARKISARLPFSFINRDWRLHNADHLAWAHAKAFELDVHFKSGGNELALMSLFMPFLGAPAR